MSGGSARAELEAPRMEPRTEIGPPAALVQGQFQLALAVGLEL